MRVKLGVRHLAAGALGVQHVGLLTPHDDGGLPEVFKLLTFLLWHFPLKRVIHSLLCFLCALLLIVSLLGTRLRLVRWEIAVPSSVVVRVVRVHRRGMLGGLRVHAHAFRCRRLGPAVLGWVAVRTLLILPSGVNVTIWVENLRRGAWHWIVAVSLLSVHILVETLFGVSTGLRLLHLSFLPVTWGEEMLHLLI